jgi:hypothetical protein
MELRNKNTITWNLIILSTLSFIIFAAFLGSFGYASFETIFDSFYQFGQFGLMFSGGVNTLFCGLAVIFSLILFVSGLILIALLKRSFKTKIISILELIAFSTIILWSALTLYGVKDEVSVFLDNWQSATYNGVVITAFYLMIASFVVFVLINLVLLFFILFTKQLEKEKTIEEIIEVEEILEEPEDEIVEEELFPEEPVEEPVIPEEKVIEKKVDYLTEAQKQKKPIIKDIVDDDSQPVEKVKPVQPTQSKPVESKPVVKKEAVVKKDTAVKKDTVPPKEPIVKNPIKKVEKKKEDDDEDDDGNDSKSGRISFEERLDASEQELKDIYKDLKTYIESYGVKSRVANSGDSYRLHAVRYLKITVAGKKLKLYYNLSPADYKDSTIPFQDVSSKKIYADVPFAFKVRSALSIKRAKELIDDMMKKVEVE